MRTAPVSLTESEIHHHLATLRENPLAANPDGWHVDWADGPWPIKVHADGRRVPAAAGGLDRLAGLLFHTFGVSRVRFDPRGGLPPTPERPVPTHHGPRFVTRRPIPSGGAMYPTEAYVLLPGRREAYHYDPYRHELVDLRLPCPIRRLCAALGADAVPSVVLVLANRFWKDFYKYGDFAFRLGAVDVGVALGRAVRVARSEFGAVEVHTGFADSELNELIGVDGTGESAYAVVAFGPPAAEPTEPIGPADGLGRPAVLERSRLIKRSELFDAVHAASCAQPAGQPLPADQPGPGTDVVGLPAPQAVDLTDRSTMLRRTSNGMLFNGDQATATELAAVLRHAADALAGLRSAGGDRAPGDVELHCAVHRTTGIPPGWYRYRPNTHDLVAVGAGRADGSARALQDALFAESVNLELAAFTVHVTGWRDHRPRGRGTRGYREQQLVVGVAVEAVTLAAAAVGLGSHPVLGFDVTVVDPAYGLPVLGRGAHAQVSVGAVRPDPNWEIAVMPR
jgi:SagB-type dehydrogenase family enzyme